MAFRSCTFGTWEGNSNYLQAIDTMHLPKGGPMYDTDLDTQMRHFNWRDQKVECPPVQVETFPSGYKEMSRSIPPPSRQERTDLKSLTLDRLSSEYYPVAASSMRVIEPFPRAGIPTTVKSRGYGQNGCIV